MTTDPDDVAVLAELAGLVLEPWQRDVIRQLWPAPTPTDAGVPE